MLSDSVGRVPTSPATAFMPEQGHGQVRLRVELLEACVAVSANLKRFVLNSERYPQRVDKIHLSSDDQSVLAMGMSEVETALALSTGRR